MFEVKIKQEIPYWDSDDEMVTESTGQVTEYVVGTFQTEHMAELFAKALRDDISRENGFVTTQFTPVVSVVPLAEENDGSEFTQEQLDFILEGRKPLEQLEFLLCRYQELLPKKNIGGIKTRAELLTTKWKMEDIIKML